MKPTPTDHALAITKAILSALPYGGPLASLIGDYVPSSTQRAQEKGVKLLGDKLAAIESRIDTEAVNKEDFAELFTTYQLVISRTNREEKLRAAANLLANLLLQPGDAAKSPYEELDHLMHCVDALSIGAISVLGAARQLTNTPTPSNAAFHFPQLRQKFPDHDPSLIMSLASELRALNLLHIQEPPISTPDYAANLLKVTPIGARFVERFIEGRM